MTPPRLAWRLTDRLTRDAKRLGLEGRRRAAGAEDLFLDYGWIRIVGPQGRVLSFEPSPVVFAKLEKTLAANALHQVVAVNMGCGREFSAQRLNRVSASGGNSSIVGTGAVGVDIRVKPLDEVPEVWQRPEKLLKIDTEGYEPEVPAGATRLIPERRPIVYLGMGGDYAESTLESTRLDKAGYDVDHVRQIDWSAVGNGSDYFFLPR